LTWRSSEALRIDLAQKEELTMKSNYLAPRYGFVHPDITWAGPPDRHCGLAVRVDVGLVAASEVPRAAEEKIILALGIVRWRFRPLLCLLAAAFVIAVPVLAVSQTNSQQGSKLVGTGAVGPAEQGWSVALSADGKTAIVGGVADNGITGAAWVYTRNGNVWTQQGSKLVGTGAVGHAGQAVSVALSDDGNTAIVGGPWDNSGAGAVWVHSRSGTVWTQQGSKLVGKGAVGKARQGVSVALSANGNTAIVGGPGDNSGTGAAWIYMRSGSAWSQQGSKLVGTGATGLAGQGRSVALSDDGNTAIVGGVTDNSGTGAAWVYARNGNVWTQQGSKLVGKGAVGNAGQGIAVALSADGNTAILGGPGDNSGTGAAWVYSRNGNVWTQQGSKLVGKGAVGNAGQGGSVALSANGNTAIMGGLADDRVNGAAWVHTRSGNVWTKTPIQELGE
jgi:antibiotic biosynthesis monooxygenase (ABM) superfamily enzyme